MYKNNKSINAREPTPKLKNKISSIVDSLMPTMTKKIKTNAKNKVKEVKEEDKPVEIIAKQESKTNKGNRFVAKQLLNSPFGLSWPKIDPIHQAKCLELFIDIIKQEPQIKDDLCIGLNSILDALQKYVSNKTMTKEMDKPFDAILCCKEDISPISLINPILQLCSIIGYENIYLITLDKGAQQQIQNALKISRVSVVGIKKDSKLFDTLLSYYNGNVRPAIQDSVNKNSWLKDITDSKTFQPTYQALSVKQINVVLKKK